MSWVTGSDDGDAEDKGPNKHLLAANEHTSRPTHKVHGSKAAVADLTEVGEQLLRIIFAEEVSHVWVLQIARPCIRGHGQGLGGRVKTLRLVVNAAFRAHYVLVSLEDVKCLFYIQFVKFPSRAPSSLPTV